MKENKELNCMVTVYPFYSAFTIKQDSFFFELLYKAVQNCIHPPLQVTVHPGSAALPGLTIKDNMHLTIFNVQIKVDNNPVKFYNFNSRPIDISQKNISIFMIDVALIERQDVFVIIDACLAQAKMAGPQFKFYFFNTVGDADFLLRDYPLPSFFKRTHLKNWAEKYSPLQKRLYSHGLKTLREINKKVSFTAYIGFNVQCMQMIFNYSENHVYEEN